MAGTKTQAATSGSQRGTRSQQRKMLAQIGSSEESIVTAQLLAEESPDHDAENEVGAGGMGLQRPAPAAAAQAAFGRPAKRQKTPSRVARRPEVPLFSGTGPVSSTAHPRMATGRMSPRMMSPTGRGGRVGMSPITPRGRAASERLRYHVVCMIMHGFVSIGLPSSIQVYCGTRAIAADIYTDRAVACRRPVYKTPSHDSGRRCTAARSSRRTTGTTRT